MKIRIALPALAAVVLLGNQLLAQERRVLGLDETSVVILKNQFSLDADRGARTVFPIPFSEPARIRVTALWDGPATSLAVIVNRPGQTGYVARRDGTSPLTLEFDVASHHLAYSGNWQISVVNFSQQGPARGSVTVTRVDPAQMWAKPDGQFRPRVIALDTLRAVPEQGARRGEKKAEPPSAPAQNQDTVVTIGPDGRIETRYPDGRIKRQAIQECGWEEEWPDGQKFVSSCMEVQSVDLPALPAGLASGVEMQAWLVSLGQNLLETIRIIVPDTSAVDNYLNHEVDVAAALVDKIKLRLQLLRRLSVA